MFYFLIYDRCIASMKQVCGCVYLNYNNWEVLIHKLEVNVLKGTELPKWSNVDCGSETVEQLLMCSGPNLWQEVKFQKNKKGTLFFIFLQVFVKDLALLSR